MRKRSFKMMLAYGMLISSGHAYAYEPPVVHTKETQRITQQNTTNIRGKVTNVKGEPLAGVSITAKSLANIKISGTSTDAKGNYEIKQVPINSVLECSYIGYIKKEMEVTGQPVMDIILEESAINLDDVVIVGYGTQKKGEVLASISSINADDIVRSTSPNVAGALVGKLPGLSNRQTQGTPGSETTIQIRNLGTPLYVIDGIIKDQGTFNNISTNDIESISIIKDGAAAIYGVKAANGVVLVKTKQGKEGKLSIGLNAYYGWQSWTRFPELANAAEYVRGDYERRINSGQLVDVETAKQELAKWEAGYYNPETGEDYRGYDWTTFVRDNVPQYSQNITASGGSERVKYYLSFSHLNQEAVFKDYSFKRYNFQSNVEANVSKNLKVGMNMSGKLETRENPGLSGDDDYWFARLGLFAARPTYRPYANDNPNYPALLPYEKELNLATMTKDISGTYNEDWRAFDGNWHVEWQSPLKGLTAKFVFDYYYADKKRNNFERAYDLYTYDYASGTYEVADRKTTSWMQRQFEGVEDKNYQFLLNYDNSFGDHHVSGVLVAEGSKRRTTNTRLAQSPVDNNFLPVLTNNPDNLAYLYDDFESRATAGFASRLSYDFKGRYLLEVAGRYDGSSSFLSNKRWGFFPSVAAGWRISEEQFFANSGLSSFLDNIKLRASYGETGDDNIDGYGYLDYIGGYTFNVGSAVIAENPSGSIDGSTVKGSQSRKTPVNQVTWYTSKMYNIGLDLGFLNNKLSSEFDFFKRQRTGLLATNPKESQMPVETGIVVPGINQNSDEVIGFDGFVKWNDNIADFNYNVGINFGYARKKNVLVANQVFDNSWDRYRWDQTDRWANVYGASNVWAAKIIGQFQSQEEIDNYPVVMDDQGNRTVLPGDFIYEDLNGDGVINDFDSRPLGYGEALPAFTFGINLGFNWKGFDFAVDFAGATMQTLVIDFEAKWPYASSNNSPAYMLNDRWHHEDIFDPTSPWVPGDRPPLRLDNWGEGGSYRRWNSYFMENTTYIRLKNLELGYTFPKMLTQKIGMEKLRLFVTGTNVFSLDNMKKYGLDPEQDGRNGLNYPQHRVYTIGFNVNF